jgi:hypothetical protein
MPNFFSGIEQEDIAIRQGQPSIKTVNWSLLSSAAMFILNYLSSQDVLWNEREKQKRRSNDFYQLRMKCVNYVTLCRNCVMPPGKKRAIFISEMLRL